MAHDVVVTNILPGDHRSQYHIFLRSDGASGELVDQVLIDPVNDLGIPASSKIVIEEITYNFSGFDARIEFDNGLVNDNMIWVLPASGDNHIDFNPWGGLKDFPGLDGSGAIQITTNGFGDAGDQGSLLVMVRNS
jgi:hypothetical protein